MLKTSKTVLGHIRILKCSYLFSTLYRIVLEVSRWFVLFEFKGKIVASLLVTMVPVCYPFFCVHHQSRLIKGSTA